MKLKKCTEVHASLSYDDAMARDGIYLFDPSTLRGEKDIGKTIYLIVSIEDGFTSTFVYRESEGILTEFSRNRTFRFFPTTKKLCFELKD
jgi:hypothetical protein